MAWYQKLNLKRPPLMSVQALREDELDVFVKKQNEDLRYKIYDLLDDPTLFFGKVYVLIGPYGSGKTSLVNFIRSNFITMNVDECPIDINKWNDAIVSQISAGTIRNSFVNQLKKKLLEVVAQDAAVKTKDSEKQEINQLIAMLKDPNCDETDICAIFNLLLKRHYHNGFTILIDELHRLSTREQYLHVLDFFKNEQAFFNDLCDKSISIFIAGNSEWEKNIRLLDYSGIYDELIVLPKWDSKSAYMLIDKRLRNVAFDSEAFQNPFTREALDYVPASEHKYTPRDWLQSCKKILERMPSNTEYITPTFVSSVFNTIDGRVLNRIKALLNDEYPTERVLLGTVLGIFPSLDLDMLNIIAYLYRESIPTNLKLSDTKKIGIRHSTLAFDILEEGQIISRIKRSNRPVVVKKKLTEMKELEPDQYDLSNNVRAFFKKLEDSENLAPEQYLLLLFDIKEDSSNNEETQTTEWTENVTKLAYCQDRAINSRAKAHIAQACTFYDKFVNGVFNEGTAGQATLRYVSRTCFNIVSAYAVEKSKDDNYQVDFLKDLGDFIGSLNVDEGIKPRILQWFNEDKEVEAKAKELDAGTILQLRIHAPSNLDQLIAQLHKWYSLPTSDREKVSPINTIERWQSNSSNIRRRFSISYYIKTVTKRLELEGIDYEFMNSYIDFLEKYNLEKILAEAIDIRSNPERYGKDAPTTYKRCLHLLSIVLEKSLVALGQNSRNKKLAEIFSANNLTPKEMLAKFFVLDDTVWSFETVGIDENSSKLEQAVETLLYAKKKNIPDFARFMKIALFIHQFYINPSCASTTLNNDETSFQKCADAFTYSLLIPFKFLRSSGQISRLDQEPRPKTESPLNILDSRYKVDENKTKSEISKF